MSKGMCSFRTFLAIFAIFWSVIQTAGNIGIGLRTHSLSPMVLGLHTLYVVMEEFVVLLSTKLPVMGRSSSKNTFGWGRSQILGVTMNSVLLAALCFSMLISALKRLALPEHQHDPILNIIVGGVSGAANIVILLIMHSYGCYTRKLQQKNPEKYEKKEDLNHLEQISLMDIQNDAIAREESLQTRPRAICDCRRTVTNLSVSILVVIVGLISFYQGNETWASYADTVATFIIVFIIIIGTYPKIRAAALVLLQAHPAHLNIDDLEKKIRRVAPELTDIHEFHLWQLTADCIVATLHVVCTNYRAFHDVRQQITKLLKSQGVHKITIQPEYTEFLQQNGKNNHTHDDHTHDDHTHADHKHGDTGKCFFRCGSKCNKVICCPEKENAAKTR